MLDVNETTRVEMDWAGPERLTMNMGPQHPSAHGVFRAILNLEGESVVGVDAVIGYLHRCHEKLSETLTYAQYPSIASKTDYVAAMTSEFAYVLAAEQIGKIEVPKRGQYLRVMCAELQRIASHLLWLGTWCMDMGGALGGGATIFLYCIRERELVLDLFEEVTGARFHYNTHTLGGNRHDLPAGWSAKVKAALDVIGPRLDEYETMTLENRIFLERTTGVGKLDAELALDLGITGPILRACGVDHDLRRDAPFHAYDEVKVNVVTATGGDCLARARVRIGEMRESVRLVREIVDAVPEGSINSGKPVKLPVQTKIPPGQVYVSIETPRGELGTYLVSDGTQFPYRLKIRPPSLHALSALPYIVPGATVSDAVAILGSMDPIMGEVDR
jgi:NADH-quinone oxidoreductase subunit D